MPLKDVPEAEVAADLEAARASLAEPGEDLALEDALRGLGV